MHASRAVRPRIHSRDRRKVEPNGQLNIARGIWRRQRKNQWTRSVNRHPAGSKFPKTSYELPVGKYLVAVIYMPRHFDPQIRTAMFHMDIQAIPRVPGQLRITER